MAVNREQIFSALFTRLQTQLASTIKPDGFSRRVVSWDDTPPAVMPALLMVKGEEKCERKHIGTPKVWMFMVELWLYVKDDGTAEAVPSIQLNNILTQIEAAFEMQPTEQTAQNAQYLARRDQPSAGTTLGGLCLGCEIMSPILIDEGTQGHTGIMRIPVEITATA